MPEINITKHNILLKYTVNKMECKINITTRLTHRKMDLNHVTQQLFRIE